MIDHRAPIIACTPGVTPRDKLDLRRLNQVLPLIALAKAPLFGDHPHLDFDSAVEAMACSRSGDEWTRWWRLVCHHARRMEARDA